MESGEGEDIVALCVRLSFVCYNPIMEQKHVLARSKNYEVSYEFEVVYLARFSSPRRNVVIGDFYGDPASAIIDKEERSVIMIGCGMIIYNLSKPFEPYQYHLQSSQWKELFRNSGEQWWIETIVQKDENTFYFTVEPNSNEGGTYELRFPTLTIQKLN